MGTLFLAFLELTFVMVAILLCHSLRRQIGHAAFYLAHQDSPEDAECRPVEGMRFHQQLLLLKLEGCDDRNAAEELRGLLVQIPIEDAAPLGEGEYYHYQLIGVEVETESGEGLGRVIEVLETGANDVYVVRGPRGEVLIPGIESVVRELDVKAKRMVVSPLPGMLDDSG